MKHSTILYRLIVFLGLFTSLSFSNLYAEKTDKYIKHGTELLDMLNTKFYKSDKGLYAEDINPITLAKGANAFIWPQAHIYRALMWGSKIDPKYTTRLKAAIEKVDWYKNGEAYGCIQGGERFFDDNGLIGYSIMHAWKEFFQDNEAIRKRALVALEYCLKYKDEFWGLPQTEKNLGEGVFYIGPVNPLASAYALSYAVTKDPEELELAKKYFDILYNADYQLKYDNSEIFRSGSRYVDGAWNGNQAGPRAANTCGVAVLGVRIYEVTQDSYYLEKAKIMTDAVLNRWHKSNGGFSEISMWGGNAIVDLLCELYDADHDTKWYYAAQKIVDFLIDKARDKNGFYPSGNTAADGTWGNVRTDSDSPEKITMMSQACAANAILRFAYLYQNTDIPDLDPETDPVYNGKRIYLSPEGSGSLNGSSWENAAAFNGDVIPADLGATAGDTLWLKAGTYNRTMTVDFAKLAIYGGFNGTETQLNERDYARNPTIMDGGGSIRLFINTSDITGMKATMDGLILQNAHYGTGNAATNNGAALNLNSGAVVRNCIVRNNSTPAKGAGVMISQSPKADLDSQVILENCLFINNTSLDANDGSSGGSAMQIGSSQAVTIINCTFANNKNASNNYGAAIGVAKTSTSNIKMYNCIIYDNINASNTKVSIQTVGSNQLGGIDGSSLFMNNAVEQPTETYFTASNGNITLSESVSPLFVNPTTYYGLQTEEAAIRAINNSSYCIEDNSPCVDAGRNSFITAKNDLDLAGKIRVRNGVIDMGAYESMYEEETSISQVKSNDLKYYVTGNEVHLLNTKSGESIRVYNTLGTVIKTVPTTENETIVPLPAHGLYIISIGTNSIKILY